MYQNKPLLILVLFFAILACSKEDMTSVDNNIGSTELLLNRQAVGSSANDILDQSIYTELIIEVAYLDGTEPTDDALNYSLSFLESRANKPDGISIQKKKISIDQKEAYSIEEIKAIERQHRVYYNTEGRLSVWILFINGTSAEANSNNLILGTAYWNTSFVIYENEIQSLTNGPFQPSTSFLESAVISHELGHLLGLTNLGSEMVSNHEDENHPKHCNNQDCLMYWAVDSSSGIDDMFNMSSPPQLDENCINDLRTNGGK
ncbi:zinc metalloprotease [Winogradskyella vincentii]|uniref:Membrane metalloprotease n=1 Tax=Winogradskyella vincentii TaxID=2877122 RepID=A0ABS7Y3C8_9FLAO|nr:membrane metalloprotease [Winogradskyella vincentii]MCA0154429.1 membrane metalloprotease [Winogradskyella vincentii]